MMSTSATSLRAYASHGLPVELMTMVLDNVDIASLVRLSHVNCRWRAVARSHPYFWKNIRLSSVSTAALDFFNARLDQTTELDINLAIRLPDALEHGRIRSVVLPAVLRNIHRVVELRVSLHQETAVYAFSAFAAAAPRLERFSLCFWHGAEKPSIPLPSDLLAGDCPKLDNLVLKNVTFPTHIITSFCHVRQLLFSCDGPYLFPLALFEHFPALRILAVHGGACLGTEPGGEVLHRVSARPLVTLEVHLAWCHHLALFGAMPNLASIPVVVCREPAVDLMRILLSHLHGVLELGVVVPRAEHLIEVLFTAPHSDHARVFVEQASRIESDWPRDVVFTPAISERVTALRLAARLAYLVPLFAELPAATVLKLEIASAGDLAVPPVAALALPALKSITVCGKPEQSAVAVSAEALRDFLAGLVGTRAAQPTLRIEDSVALSGDSAALMRDYGDSSAAAK